MVLRLTGADLRIACGLLMLELGLRLLPVRGCRHRLGRSGSPAEAGCRACAVVASGTAARAVVATGAVLPAIGMPVAIGEPAGAGAVIGPTCALVREAGVDRPA